MGAEGTSDLVQAGFNHEVPRCGGGRHPGRGLLCGRLYRQGCSMENWLLSWGKGVFLLSLEVSTVLLYPGSALHQSVHDSNMSKRKPLGGLSPLAGEGVQRFSDPALVSPPCAPAMCPAAAHCGGKCCTGVTPVAQPVLPRWRWLSEVNPASSSSPLQAAAGERGPGWTAQGRLP